MNTLKALAPKRSSKQDREKRVLFGLIEQYLQTGKPVGSNTLKGASFEDLSSATIRNYFSVLEKEGYLAQQHSSGGRIPTHKALRLYAGEQIEALQFDKKEHDHFQHLRGEETKEIASFLGRAAEHLSLLSNTPVFLSAPRFDHDFITEIKLVPLDQSRCLGILVTDFGTIQTEVLYVDKKLSSFSAKRIEDYFQWRLKNIPEPQPLEKEEEDLAQKIYKELMLRFVIGYSHFTESEIHRTGLSKLLAYPEYQDLKDLASSMSLLENSHSMRLLLKECTKMNTVKFWIGDDLNSHTTSTPNCAVIAAPYHVHNQAVGAIGILGPTRLPYKFLFSQLLSFAKNISEALTRNLFKFKINYRQPSQSGGHRLALGSLLLGCPELLLIENKSEFKD